MIERDVTEITELVQRALGRFIAPAAAAEETARQLVAAEAQGKTSHGLVRVAWLRGKLGACHHLPARVIREDGPVCHVDAGDSLGYVAAMEAVDRVAARAREHGWAVVVCRDIFPTGVLGEYVRPLAAQGLVAGALAGTPPLVSLAPDGPPVLGTNPVALAVPHLDGALPLVSDIAVTPATFGQILAARYVPEGYPAPPVADLPVTTADGHPATDPADVCDGRGGFTGHLVQHRDSPEARRRYALSLSLEVLGALLAGDAGRGHLVLAAGEAGPLGLDLGAVERVLTRVAAAAGPGAIPGRRQPVRRRLRLPPGLWRALTDLAEVE